MLRFDAETFLIAYRAEMDRDEEPRESACVGLPIFAELPKFESSIPPELSGKLDAKYRSLFLDLSRMQRMEEWTAQRALEHNQAIHRLCLDIESLKRQLNGMAVERKIQSAKFTIPIIIGTIAGTVLVTKLLEKLLNAFLP